jgi:hypothetical protein
MRVLVACEESQEVCKAFRERGHEAYSCDLQDCSGGHPEWHIKADALFARMADGGNYHVGEPDDWCLTFKDVVTAIEDFCEYKLTGRYSLSAPVGNNWDVMNAYKYDDPFKEY